MQALRLTDGRVSVQAVAPPEPGPGEALVRVRVAGICNTDLEIASGYMGFSGTLGHEFVGEVIACDEASWVGKRVTGEINLACRKCQLCQQGLARHCPTRSVLGILHKDGCFAEQLTLPVENLHEVPDGLDDRDACFVEPTAAAFEVLEQVPLETRDRVAVLGSGKLGLLVAQVLQQHGAHPVLTGRNPRSLAVGKGLGLATRTPQELDSHSFDVVVEATGAAEGFATAVTLLRPRGTLVLKSTFHGPLELDAAPLVIDELTVVGSRCGPFEPAIVALREGRVRPASMVEEVFPLARGLDALQRAQQPGALKVLLTP